MYMECHTTRRCRNTLRTFNFVFVCVCVCVCTLLVQSLLTLNLRKQQSHSQLLGKFKRTINFHSPEIKLIRS